VVYYPDYEAAEDEMLRGRLDVIVMNSSEGVHFLTDGTFPRRALDVLYVSDKLMYGESVPAEFQILFNAGRRYNHYYLVSLIILVVTLVGTALITLNIVRERENGVEEQLHCAVINRLVYFGGKYVFFMMLSLLQVMLCYLFCNVVYGLESGGLFVDYMGVIFVSLFPLLGLGYVIASFSENQLQAVYLLTIVLVLATMLSTMFTHLSSMPCWAASLRYINPVYYAVEGSRMILLKGGSILDAGTLLLHMMFLGVLFFGIFFLKISRRF
jgi:ABC-2 type transport system permease protein